MKYSFTAMVLLALAAFSSVANGAAGINREKRPDGPPKPPAINCKDRAQSIKDQYEVFLGLKERLGADANVAQDLFRLRKQWANLKAECPDIGSLDSGKPDLPPTKALKSDEWKEMMEDQAKQLDREASYEEQEAKGDVAVLGEWGKKIPLVDLGAAIHERSAAEDREQAQAIRDLIKDPPSLDYAKPVVVKPVFEWATNDSSDGERLASAASRAARECRLNIQAYTTSFERYQGAKQAADYQAMAVQARGMLEFAIAAQEAARIATLKRSELERLLAGVRKSAAAELEAKAQKPSLSSAQKRLETEGFSAESRQAMARAGITDDEMESLRKRLLAFTPEETEKAVADRKIRAETDEAVKSALAARRSRAAWPPPVGLLALEKMEFDARDLYRPLLQTHLELSSSAPKAGATAKPGAKPALPDWWAISAGAAPRLHDELLIKSPTSAPLAPGKYDIYLLQNGGRKMGNSLLPSAVRIAQDVVLEEGKPTVVRLRTGLELQPAKGASRPLSWFVVPSETSFIAPAAECDGRLPVPMWLVPGKYDVYCIYSEAHRARPLLLKKGVEVKEGQIAPVAIEGSSVEIKPAAWVPQLDPSHGSWSIVQAGDEAKYAVAHSAKLETLAAIPGKFDVYWVQDYAHAGSPMLLARGVELKPGALTTVRAASGLRLQVPKWVTQRDAKNGWWGAVRSGDTADARVNWSNQAEELLLPAGKYDAYWVQDHAHVPSPLCLAQGIEVKPDELTTVTINTGIRLALPPNPPALNARDGWWGVITPGADLTRPMHWSTGKWDERLLLPAGTYHIVWKRDNTAKVRLLKSGIVLKEREQATQPTEVQIESSALTGPP